MGIFPSVTGTSFGQTYLPEIKTASAVLAMPKLHHNKWRKQFPCQVKGIYTILRGFL
jgi:hypothetical protein